MSPERPFPPASEPDPVVARFLAGTATATEWDHPAHLRAFAHLLEVEGSAAAAYERMRSLILAHNARVSPNGEHGRYHETITRYYVAAVATALADEAESGRPALDRPEVDREAPLRHWSRDLLLSEEARSTWVPPDLLPLPWSTNRSGAIHASARCTC